MHVHRNTVLVADSRELVRNGVKALVRTLLGEVRFLEAADARALRDVPALDTIRLGLVDPSMPGVHAGRCIEELGARFPRLRLVAIAATCTPAVSRRTLCIPTVYAVVPISASLASARAAIEAALAGRKQAPAKLAGGSAHPALTPRQREICGLLRSGMTNKAIADTLGISQGTVKNYISEIFRALKATNRTQAARLEQESE